MFNMYSLYFIFGNLVYCPLFIITFNTHCMSTYAFLRQSTPGASCISQSIVYYISVHLFHYRLINYAVYTLIKSFVYITVM
jgi:hypothetical protein